MLRSSGFTLLELLLVLLILGLAYGLALPMLDNGSLGLELKSSARQVAAGLRTARSQAVSRRIEAVMTIDIEKKTFQITDDPKTYPLSNRLELSLFTAQTELEHGASGSIRFFPDGSSTGGRVSLTAGKEVMSVDVNWLTGRVSIL